ncbi:hypothetical protein [Streptomyces luteireticuli]|uniref:Phage gp6-like head-tail connector protein n=1 Tax=Streptomyces luteireticuli TaxID=173858 RepID=A0ABN0YR53_9ACTN
MPVSVVDIETRMGRTFEESERPRVEAFIVDAAALIQDYCGPRFDADAPVVRAVLAAEVMRWLAVQPGIVSERTGDMEIQYGPAASAQSLSPAAKAGLRRYRPALGTIPLTRGEP